MTSWPKLLMISALFFLLQVSIPWVTASNANVVTGVFIETEEVLHSAYAAVLDAERAGANVSVLLDRLNLAGEYLSEAYFWYRSGDSETANRFAGLCRDAVGNVRNEAVELMDAAKAAGDAEFVETVFESIVGVIVIVVSCYVVWLIFKRRYRRQVLGLKPEVGSSES